MIKEAYGGVRLSKLNGKRKPRKPRKPRLPSSETQRNFVAAMEAAMATAPPEPKAKRRRKAPVIDAGRLFSGTSSSVGQGRVTGIHSGEVAVLFGGAPYTVPIPTRGTVPRVYLNKQTPGTVPHIQSPVSKRWISVTGDAFQKLNHVHGISWGVLNQLPIKYMKSKSNSTNFFAQMTQMRRLKREQN